MINNYIEFQKVQICGEERLPINTLYYFEDMIVYFDFLKEINNNKFFIKAIVNEMKMLK